MRPLVLVLALFASCTYGSAHAITPIVGGISGSGTTTRYWDCCKPACSWEISMPNKRVRPVKSCAVDGVTALDVGVKSGCTNEKNNKAFMCNDEAPWAVNQTFSYGFAAFSAAGGVDLKKCCACMLLKFKGQLSGKQMLVQITNTGGDLHENHFDIAIPGGGVGLFNGCVKQWHTSDAGWGDRITGVADRKACDTLPHQLQAGCRFRFDFMEGVPNPDVDFWEVKCPKALTQRTGCILQEID